MAYEELSLQETIGKAYARALLPRKLIKLIQAKCSGLTDSSQSVEDDIAAAIIPYLLPSPPSLILIYLSQILESNLITSRTIFIHFLFYLADHDLPSISSITSITNILLNFPTGLEDPIPSLLSPPSTSSSDDPLASRLPDVGPSTSTSAPVSRMNSPKIHQISTLSLLLPLLRICSINPQSPSITSLTSYLSRVVSVLSNFPTPSLDIGLEAGQLLPTLPEEISSYLRVTLSDLMTDLDTQDLITQSQTQSQPQDNSQSHDNGNNQNNQDIQMGDASIKRGESVLPIKQALTFLVEWAKRSSKSSNTQSIEDSERGPKEPWISILKCGKDLARDPNELITVLLEVTIQNLIGSNTEGLDAAENWGILVEDVCRLIGWWKGHSDENFPFPSDITSPLSTIFQTYLPSMQTYSEQIMQRYNNLVQHAENEEEGSSFTPLEGWNLLSLQETLISKLVQSDVITQEQASAIAPGVNVYTFTPGESLTNRISSESHAHLPPLVHTIQYAYSASSTFTTELIQIIKSCPVTQSPENLFNFVASQPGLIGVLSTHVNPVMLLDIMQKQLLDLGVDESSRIDDPQGSLTRFGEGVALVEAFAAYHRLPLPPLLEDARRADNFSHLSNTDKECMNGWIKAIFGSDGIEDAILLATPPQKLYKLAPTLIQQAIAAVAASQIDLDTLHSGLSYFSQPLLSWCLGGVVAWLCKEIKRQGLLSALHLVVLQDLILGHACPEALIRVNSKALNDLLNPTSGLSLVFESSNFDIVGIRNKLDSLGLNASLPSQQNINTFKGALGQLRQVDLAPLGWEKVLLDSLDKEIDWKGSLETLNSILQQTQPQTQMPNQGPQISTQNNLLGFIPLLLSINIKKQTDQSCLLDTMINSSWISKHLIDSKLSSSSSILGILKKSLLFYSDLHFTLSSLDRLISILIDELEYLLSKSVIQDETAISMRGANGDASGDGNSKKRKFNDRFNKLNASQRNLVENLVRGIRDDEDLRTRYRLISRLDDLL